MALTTASLGIAGDINTDGKGDGADNVLVQAGGVEADITGDGFVNASDRQLVQANYGFLANLAPELAGGAAAIAYSC